MNDNIVVKNNMITNSSIGIWVSGENASLISNTISLVDGYYAVNVEGENAVIVNNNINAIKDIENKKIDEIICLGDTIDIGPNSKECIDKLIDNNIKMTLGNHELYLLRGTSIDSSINNVEEIEHYKWVKNQLSEKEINFIKKCPLYYTINVDYENKKFNKEIILSHYLIED